MSRRISSAEFVGREPQIGLVRAALEEGAAAGGRTLLVGGEAGIGKTRFVRELARLPSASPYRFLVGRCLGIAGSLPFAPFREALRGFNGSDSTLAAVIETDGIAQPGPVSPGAASPLGFSAGDPGRLFELVLGLLQREAATGPLALVIEDLHWAQASTLDLFAFLAANPGEAPVVLIGTFRSDVGRRHRLWPVISELAREATVERFELPRLLPEEVGRLCTGIRGAAGDAATVELLAARSGGNPFFVEEMLAASHDPGAPLPESLREALRQRVFAVSHDAQAILRIATVAGLRFDERLLRALTGSEDADLWPALRELVEANLLVADDARDRAVYAFRHALIREAIDDDLLPGERIRLHARVAAFLGANPDAAVGGVLSAAGDVADHWEAGRDLARALPSHLGAARLARRMFALPEALRHLERVVSLWDRVGETERPSDERRVGILAEAADAAALAGHQDRAVELVRLALAGVDSAAEPAVAARLLERQGQYLWESGDDAAGHAARREALALLPAGGSPDRARVLAAIASSLVVSGRHAEARMVAAEALAASREAASTPDEASVRVTLGVLAAADGDLERAEAQLLEGRRLAAQVGDPYQRVRAFANHAAILGNAGRLQDALAVAREGADLAREVGLYRSYGRFLVTNAVVALIALGEWDEADALAAAALAEASSGVLAAHLHLVRAQLLVSRGRFAEADDHLRAASDRASRSEDPALIATLAATNAELALWRGDADAAWAQSAAAIERLSATALPPELAPLAARAAADRAERARLRRGTPDIDGIAAGLETALASYRAPATGTDEATRRALIAAAAESGRLAGHADPAAFDDAATGYEAAGMPYPAAYLRYRQAEAMLNHSRVRTQTAAILGSARRAAVRLGARPLIEEIDGLARRARLDLSDAASEPVVVAEAAAPGAGLGLTEREIEVLGLVASGMTNRQIADILFISPKTAGAHVSNIIGKLGVSGRVEAATIAERVGLTDPGSPEPQ